LTKSGGFHALLNVRQAPESLPIFAKPDSHDTTPTLQIENLRSALAGPLITRRLLVQNGIASFVSVSEPPSSGCQTAA
jgi:hypothetical protein